MTALLIDLDGTLLDTPSAIARVLHEVLRDLGRDADPEAIRATIGRPLDGSVAGLLGVPADDPLVGRVVDRYRALFAATVLPTADRLILPGVVDALRRARLAGLPLAVATSKVSASATALLEGAGLARLFAFTACHDMVERGKPQPDLALLAAGALGVPAAECVVVGDGVDDMRMAAAAGMVGFGVTTGVGSGADLLAAGAAAVFSDLTAVVDAVTAGRLVAP
jgi:phosphoglycolate phosphatase